MIQPSPLTEKEKIRYTVCNSRVRFELFEQKDRKWTVTIKGAGRKIKLTDLALKEAHRQLVRAIDIRAEWEKQNGGMGK